MDRKVITEAHWQRMRKAQARRMYARAAVIAVPMTAIVVATLAAVRMMLVH